MVIIFASATNGLFQIDNYYKAALPGESVNFDMSLVNNEVNRETFLIHHAWENSVLYLPMDEGSSSIAYDQSGFGNDGAISGASWVDGKIGKALSFDGTNDYVKILHSPSIDLYTGDFSIVFWLNFAEVHVCTLIAKDSYHRTFEIQYRTDMSAFEFNCRDPDIKVFYSDIFVPVIGEWYFVAVTYKTSESKGVISINAVPKESIIVINPRTRQDGWHVYVGMRTDSTALFKGVIDEVRVYNRALTAEEIGWLYNNSWSESLSRYTVELEPGESTQVTFRVKVPEDARVGHVQKFLLTAFPLSNPEHVETQTVTVEVLPKYGVEVTLDENEKKGKPGEILNFQAAIRNLGNIKDTYDIQANGGEGWNLSLPAEYITVPAGEVGSFNISVTVPLDALLGDYASFRIQAASRGNQNLTTNVNGTAIATAIYRFSITADPEFRQASPGSEAIFSLEITNLGTANDTIIWAFENLNNWQIEVELTSHSLEIGETGKATVRVHVPENAFIGQTNTIKIIVVSSGDTTVLANSSISIEIVTPFWDIPYVRFIVGLSIGVLVGATLISTIILRRAQINRKENRRS